MTKSPPPGESPSNQSDGITYGEVLGEWGNGLLGWFIKEKWRRTGNTKGLGGLLDVVVDVVVVEKKQCCIYEPVHTVRACLALSTETTGGSRTRRLHRTGLAIGLYYGSIIPAPLDRASVSPGLGLFPSQVSLLKLILP